MATCCKWCGSLDGPFTTYKTTCDSCLAESKLGVKHELYKPHTPHSTPEPASSGWPDYDMGEALTVARNAGAKHLIACGIDSESAFDMMRTVLPVHELELLDWEDRPESCKT